jgi:hypothetical protein
MPVIPPMWPAETGRSWSRLACTEPPDPIQNSDQSKTSWGHDSSGRALLSKHEALSSNPNTTKNKNVVI